jgi:hypothetical protein
VQGLEAFGPGVAAAVLKELQKGELAKLMLARREQRLAAAAGRERRTMRFGEVKMMIHPAFYHYWGQRLGYECWQDKQFCREFARDNDEVRVHSQGRAWTRGTGAPRFHKSYGELGARRTEGPDSPGGRGTEGTAR